MTRMRLLEPVVERLDQRLGFGAGDSRRTFACGGREEPCGLASWRDHNLKPPLASGDWIRSNKFQRLPIWLHVTSLRGNHARLGQCCSDVNRGSLLRVV